MNLLSLFLVFFKFGLLCFGGGYMLVPLLNSEFVLCEPQILTAKEFGNLVSVAQATPGPIGINTATYVGFEQQGVPGALCATFGLVLPSAILVLLAIRLLKKYEKHWLVQGFLTGMRPAAFGLILAAALIFAEMSVFTGSIPWTDFLRYMAGGKWAIEGFSLRPLALLLAVATTVLMLRTKVPFTWILLGAAGIGAFFF